MECQFILGSNNDKICHYYWKLRCIISKIYQNDKSLEKQDYQQRIYDILKDHEWRSQSREQIFNYDYISSVISNVVCKYLFDFNVNCNNNINYQIRCFENSSFDSKDGMLSGNQCWSSMMRCDMIKRSTVLHNHKNSVIDSYVYLFKRCDYVILVFIAMIGVFNVMVLVIENMIIVYNVLIQWLMKL